ncbi:MAG: DUF58 domain-containing protein [Pseudomonadota bacterium]
MVTLDPGHLLKLRALARRTIGAQSVTSLPGGFVTRARGQGLETADLRAYADGDDPRHIDRNATARSGHMQVRTFQAERDRTTLLIADFRPSMLWGTRRTLRSIAAAEALAVAGWRAVIEGGRVGMLAISAADPVFVAPRTRDRSMVAAIGAMARCHARAMEAGAHLDPPLDATLEFAQRLAPRGASVVMATAFDTCGAGFEEAARALTRRCNLSVLRVVDAFETDAPRKSFRYCTATGRSGTAPPPGGLPTTGVDDMVTGIVTAALSPEEQLAVA